MVIPPLVIFFFGLPVPSPKHHPPNTSKSKFTDLFRRVTNTCHNVVQSQAFGLAHCNSPGRRARHITRNVLRIGGRCKDMTPREAKETKMKGMSSTMNQFDARPVLVPGTVGNLGNIF